MDVEIRLVGADWSRSVALQVKARFAPDGRSILSDHATWNAGADAAVIGVEWRPPGGDDNAWRFTANKGGIYHLLAGDSMSANVGINVVWDGKQ